jgi:hypothetical protein
VWFVHPFGFDFEYFIVPDPQYESLLGAHNTGRDAAGKVIDTEYDAATRHARDVFGLNAAKGVLGVETDQDLVPPSFRDRVVDGARIATFGRWIVDCGHDDFHTEIHPPLLTAVATPTPPPLGLPGASQVTRVEIMSRPYTVSQKWEEGNFASICSGRLRRSRRRSSASRSRPASRRTRPCSRRRTTAGRSSSSSSSLPSRAAISE